MWDDFKNNSLTPAESNLNSVDDALYALPIKIDQLRPENH